MRLRDITLFEWMVVAAIVLILSTLGWHGWEHRHSHHRVFNKTTQEQP